MRKLLICALALGGVAASAQAADLGSMKDPLPDAISYAGVTVYGQIDVGYAYAEHSTGLSGSMYVGVPLTMWGNKAGNGSISSLNENALSQSKVGVKIEENIGMGFTAIGKLETDFNPLSGEIADACQSIVRNSKLPLQQQNTNGDGSRCGQAFGDQAWAGVSNATYGTLTFGRQYSLENEALGKYDAMGQSYALSNLGFTATGTAGDGATELSRWDNSVKYVYQYGPAHAAGMYSNGGQDTGIFGHAFGADAGVTWKGFSVDGVYTKENGAASLSNAVNYAYSVNAGLPATQKSGISSTVTDNEMYSVMGKYTMDLGGGFKDEEPSAKLTFYGGYAHVDLTNHNGFISATEGTIGGYAPASWNTTPFAAGSDKVLQSEWAGAKYETGPWSFAAAFYHVSQDAYLTSTGTGTCASGYSVANNGPKNPQASNCAGNFNQVSLLVDYTFTKHFDVYAGASWSNASGGLASDYLQNQNAGVITGMRLKF